MNNNQLIVKNIITLFNMAVNNSNIQTNKNNNNKQLIENKDYLSIIDSTFIILFHGLSNGELELEYIIENSDKLIAGVCAKHKKLNSFYNILKSDYKAYKLLNDIYCFDKTDSNSNSIILTGKDFIKMMLVFIDYIMLYEFTNEYDIDEILGELVEKAVITQEMLDDYNSNN